MAGRQKDGTWGAGRATPAGMRTCAPVRAPTAPAAHGPPALPRLYPTHQGHRNAVLEVHWFQDGETLLSCSADKTVRAWDAEVGSQTKKLAEHSGIVNSCCPLRRGPKLFVSGGDDSAVKVSWGRGRGSGPYWIRTQ